MAKIKVIQLISHLDLGGAECVAINIAKSINSDFEYHIVEVEQGYSEYSKSLKKRLKDANIMYHTSPIRQRKLAIILFPLWFTFIYLRLSPNVIHIHTEIPDLAAYFFRNLSWIFFWIRPKYIRTIHNTELWNDWINIGKKVEPFYISHHSNVAISSSTKKCYEEHYGQTDIPIIYNGLEEVEQKEFPDLKKGTINILFAGRLEYQKGIDELIAVITAFKNDKQFHFTIVGSGSMEHKIKESLIGFNNVSIYEKIFGLSHYLSSFDYLFMPSNHEGLALMSIEASFSHTPTIINCCPGLKDTLPNDWKLAVNKNSIPDFIDLIISVH